MINTRAVIDTHTHKITTFAQAQRVKHGKGHLFRGTCVPTVPYFVWKIGGKKFHLILSLVWNEVYTNGNFELKKLSELHV